MFFPTACSETRDYALKHRAKNPPKFIPRCKSDGTYALIQCLSDSGCWCSDITGTPIENTSVRTGKPKCREFSKANMRRSPSRNSGGNKKRPCSQYDRATFNSNIIKVFQSEYIRMSQQQRDMSNRRAMDAFTPPSDSEVLDWKFSQLDVNTNQMLDKNEYRELKKLVKRVSDGQNKKKTRQPIAKGGSVVIREGKQFAYINKTLVTISFRL